MTYVARALLGVTDVALIDNVVDGLAAGDGRLCSRRSERLIDAGTIAPVRDRSPLAGSLLLQAVPEAGRSLEWRRQRQLTRMREQSRC